MIHCLSNNTYNPISIRTEFFTCTRLQAPIYSKTDFGEHYSLYAGLNYGLVPMSTLNITPLSARQPYAYTAGCI